jgi:poly(A) polymerase
VSGSADASVGGAAWLGEPDLQRLLGALARDGEEARVVGGAVRNALMGLDVTDIDVATTTTPDETVRRAEAAGFRAIPTGAEHGTVTVITGGRPVEVTTLRADVETDGRHARVVFGRDWKRDAERRDFTINALYAKPDGSVVDLVGGLADLEDRRLRFIGDPAERIREDYLRILRFFRFFAWYGNGRPDAEGLKACVRLKEGLARLSAERVWAELRKLLAAPDPARALLWMRQASVLTAVLPESEKWGIDAVHGLVDAERRHGWAPDALLRLAAIIPPDVARIEALADRLKMSGAEANRLREWASTLLPAADIGTAALRRLLYAGAAGGYRDRLRLASTSGRDAQAYRAMSIEAESWTAPSMPVSGSDLKALGLLEGPRLGAVLRELERLWVESDFTLDRGTLLERAAGLSGDREIK